MKTHSLHVTGTHCASCKMYIEETLKEQKNIQDAVVDLESEQLAVTVVGTETSTLVASRLTKILQSNGYTVSENKSLTTKNSTDELWIAIPIGIGVLLLFFLLQKSGVLNVGFGGQITPTTSFMIGVIASVSSCLAIVGGLILSLSAKMSQDGKSTGKSIFLFHLGRVGGFALLGGLLGALGGAIGINFTFTTILGIIASVVMLVLGLNLIGVIKKNPITLPSKMFSFLRGIERTSFAPIALGFATFFLPCGFTQSMQVSALSSGSFFTGLLIMLAFAIGTLPVLALLSFGSASFSQGKHASIVFKSAGIVVIGLGLFSFLSGLASLGIIDPTFTI